MTYHSDTTLGDLNQIDRDNFAHVLKDESVIYQLKTQQEARQFMGQCVDECLRKCGVKIYASMGGSQYQAILDEAGVKIEYRPYPADEPLYQTGLYIYKNHEIAGFVSSPFQYITRLHVPTHFCIRTTVKMPDIIMPGIVGRMPAREM